MSRFALVLSLGTALGILSIGSEALADKLKNVTCEQFLAMDESEQDDIVYWVHGAAAAADKKHVAAEDVEVGYDIFGRPVAEVVTACKADRKTSLLDKIKAHF